MFFFKDVNIFTNTCKHHLFIENSSRFYKILFYLHSNKTCIYYFICSQYDGIMIIHSYLIVNVVSNQSMHIDYLNSNHNIGIFKSLNSALLIMNIYSLLIFINIRILILEVHSCNLNAFSLYYWSGFQVINRRCNYYNIKFSSYLYNTAYTLLNRKYSSKNMFRRYLL